MRLHDFINEYADPDDRSSKTFHQGSAHYAPETLWDRPGFKEWFNGSHVVAPNHQPLVAFHGTFEQFSEFAMENGKKVSYGFNRLGYWFDIDPRTPEFFAGYNYGGNNEIKDEPYGTVMPCVLSIKRPFHFDSEYVFVDDVKELRDAYTEMKDASERYFASKENSEDYNQNVSLYGLYSIAKQKYNKKRDQIIAWNDGGIDRADGYTAMMKKLPNGMESSNAQVDEFRQELISAGYDGIYFGDTAADFETRDYAGTDWWVAFYPNQIKSIFAQSFSANSNDIMK